MSIWKAIIVGHLLVNVPAVAIIIAISFLGSIVVPWPFALLGGSLMAWVWWSFTVPRWRDWAVAKGVDRDRLQKYAVRTGLTWPKGSPFEKTEFRKGK